MYIIVDYFLTEHIEGPNTHNKLLYLCIYCNVFNYVAVKKIGSEFVLGYIQAIDGEKDPRNLVIVFNSVQRIIQHLPFGLSIDTLYLVEVLLPFIHVV